MTFLQYLLILLTSFSGIIFGYVLSLIAPEELNPGKKYFEWLARFLVLLIMIFYIINTPLTIFPLLFLAIIILMVIFSREYLFYIYPLFGLVIWASLYNQQLLIIQSSLIFILGIVISSMYMVQHEKKEEIIGSKFNILLQILLRTFLFLVIGVLFFLFF
ncbi:hypothetical protein HN695_04215 [Candidatus Woesearchaeota archaeon]|nr:hypothetical protein [Candidatus Woesearchaeota archaeon]MBT5272354.1 hypothetical protein [Candidatus Woesearchaeota archaeon]MBT6336626.1 hypothetical protein [Candidatus Woesearchaeota archaeon]MBT7927516.1 hypothetical protein [Candidatus Woesearchaeota archaeon]